MTTQRCKYLIRIAAKGRIYADCDAKEGQCPKATNKREIGQRCWQVRKE